MTLGTIYIENMATLEPRFLHLRSVETISH